MFRFPATTLRAAAISIPALLATVVAIPILLATSIAAPANAQIGGGIGFDSFYNELAPYGTWSNNARWGDVWRPHAGPDFRPYYNGRWENTREYGALWVADEPWGDIPYHYGRWVFDPREGWLWVPGYVWGPSWVVWREGGGNIGWFPMPPGDNYYGDGVYGDNFDNQYGYRDWYGPSFGNEQFLSLWLFIGLNYFGDRNFRNYVVPQRNYGGFFSQTTNITNYVTINNYVVNRSIDTTRFPRGNNQRFQPVPASSVIGRNALVTQAGAGRQVEQRERQRRPIPANINPAEQRDRGNVNSGAQQQNRNQLPQGAADRGGDRGPNSNGTGPSNPQPNRGAATAPATPEADTVRQNDRGQANVNPAEQRGRANQNSNAPQPNIGRVPRGTADRGDDRGPNSNGIGPSNPQANRGAATAPVTTAAPEVGTSRQTDRGRANINPAEQRERANQEPNAPQPNINRAPQGSGDRRVEQAPVTDTPTPRNNAAAQGQAERRDTGQRPPLRATPEQNVNVAVPVPRPATRVQENTPAADAQSTPRANQARATRQTDRNAAEETRAVEARKNAETNRRRN
jgi:hypothetical protein